MRLADPWVLILLPFVIGIILLMSRRTGGRFKFSDLTLIKPLVGNSGFKPALLLGALRIVAMTLFIVALSRPQSGKKVSEVSSNGVDIMLAMDTSGSMAALDLKINGESVPRVDVVKKVVSDFISKDANDRIGLVVFAETAFVQCPLTLDHRILSSLLNNVHLGVAGDSTAIGDAIAVAVKHMKDLKAKSRVLVLLTDGQNNSGMINPLKAAELAKVYQVKIYTIGVGVEGEAPFLVDTPFGKRVVYQQADLDEDTLKQVSNITGGVFYRAKDSDTLEKIYAEIGRLEKTPALVKEYTDYNELYAGFALMGLSLLLGEIILGQTWLRKVP